MAKKKYKGKYAEMAERFRKDGCDEYTVEKFIRQQMEEDEKALAISVAVESVDAAIN